MKKRIVAIGRRVLRVCPVCYKRRWITIVETGEGWERWNCEDGHCKEYCITGRAN